MTFALYCIIGLIVAVIVYMIVKSLTKQGGNLRLTGGANGYGFCN